jgi:hypothetical protein
MTQSKSPTYMISVSGEGINTTAEVQKEVAWVL